MREPLDIDAALTEMEAIAERDRKAGGYPWEVKDHPDHQLPGGWTRGQVTTAPVWPDDEG